MGNIGMRAGGGLSGAKLGAATAGTGDVLSGKTFYAGEKTLKTGAIPSKGAATYGAKTSAQTIGAGQYLSGAQTFAAVTQSNLSAANIVQGKTVTIASNGANLWSVAGSAKGSPALLCSAAFLPGAYGGNDNKRITLAKTVNYYNSTYFDSSGTCVRTGKYSVMRFEWAAAGGDAYAAVDIKVGSTAYNSTGASAGVNISSGTATTCSAIYEGTGSGSNNRVVAVLAIFAEI